MKRWVWNSRLSPKPELDRTVKCEHCSQWYSVVRAFDQHYEGRCTRITGRRAELIIVDDLGPGQGVDRG